MSEYEPDGRIFELANDYIEGRLDDTRREDLETLLQQDANARRVFMDFLHDHATLHWNQVGSEGGEIIDFPGLDADPRPSPVAGWWRAWAAAAAVAVVGLGWNMSPRGPTAFAVMEQTRSARWESGELPTSEGARLGSGRLRLAEGLATIRFDSGAKIVLEAPVEIELIDQMNCVLRRGTAVAEVPDSAIGFRITTPSASVVDYGTRFAVNVDFDTGATKTHVFEGEVEVEHPDSGKVVRLETGQRNFVAGGKLGTATAGPEEGDWAGSRDAIGRGPEWRTIPTARDQYVYSIEIKNHMSDILLLLKNTDEPKGPNRKTYLGFDLSDLDRKRITDAELTLNFVPTGWGLASGVPDSRFSVYGLIGGEADGWTEDGLTWENAPANLPGRGGSLSEGAARKLGSFVLTQGIQRGRFGISGATLAEFLREDQNGFATLVIVRDTLEKDRGGLVHGIASRRHPILPAPSLALRLSK